MTYPINTTVPAAGNNPSNDQQPMQTNFANIKSYLSVDHTTPGSNPGDGQHLQVTFNSNNTPSVPTSPPVLFTMLAGSNPQLFFYSGSAGASSNQYYTSQATTGTNTTGVDGSTFLLGGIIIKFGTFALSGGSSTGIVSFKNAFPSACFTVLCDAMDGGATPDAYMYAFSQTTSGFSVTATKRVSTNPLNGLNGYYIAIGN